MAGSLADLTRRNGMSDRVDPGRSDLIERLAKADAIDVVIGGKAGHQHGYIEMPPLRIGRLRKEKCLARRFGNTAAVLPANQGMHLGVFVDGLGNNNQETRFRKRDDMLVQVAIRAGMFRRFAVARKRIFQPGRGSILHRRGENFPSPGFRSCEIWKPTRIEPSAQSGLQGPMKIDITSPSSAEAMSMKDRSTLRRGDFSARECPACNRSTAHALRFRIGGSDILQCCSCGLGRSESDAFNPEDYYTDDYFCGRRADGYSDYLAAEPVLQREFARTLEFIRRLVPCGRLLEIGCAYGFFLMEARRHFKVNGIELAQGAVEHARRAGLKVVHGVADEPTLAAIGPVDVMVMLDVIEHLREPRDTLALCHRHLNPGGIVVITTGDFGSVAARLTGARWRLMTPPQHLWFFTRESMSRM